MISERMMGDDTPMAGPGGAMRTLSPDEKQHIDFLERILARFSENARAYVQMALAALVLPTVFLRQIVGAPAGKSFWEQVGLPASIAFGAAWLLLFVAVGAGLLYQYLAVKLVESAWEVGEDATVRVPGLPARWANEPRLVYGTMMWTFYLGVMLFLVGAALALGG
jgi:hypothetical protein